MGPFFVVVLLPVRRLLPRRIHVLGCFLTHERVAEFRVKALRIAILSGTTRGDVQRLERAAVATFESPWPRTPASCRCEYTPAPRASRTIRTSY